MSTIHETVETLKNDFMRVGKRERMVIAGILISAFGLGAVAVYQLGTISSGSTPTTYTQPKAAEPQQSTGTVPITLTADQNTLSNGDTFTITMSIDSGNQGVEAAEFSVMFDPEILSIENVETGTFFKTYPRNETGNGIINISGIAEFQNNTFVIPKGQGTIATLTFRALKSGSASIYMDQGKTIVASGGDNAAGTLGTIDIQIN